MLRNVLLGVGALLLFGALFVAVLGHWSVFPHLLIGGLILTVGIAWERWRYKPTSEQVDPRWTDTGERFTDPGSGALVAVYSDPVRGQRHYVRLG
ncbi:MAG: hypothetical protein WBW61_06090 [Rhodanobacteraceae bacterium]